MRGTEAYDNYAAAEWAAENRKIQERIMREHRSHRRKQTLLAIVLGACVVLALLLAISQT